MRNDLTSKYRPMDNPVQEYEFLDLSGLGEDDLSLLRSVLGANPEQQGLTLPWCEETILAPADPLLEQLNPEDNGPCNWLPSQDPSAAHIQFGDPINGAHLELTSDIDGTSGDESSQTTLQDVGQVVEVTCTPPMLQTSGMEGGVATTASQAITSHSDMLHGPPGQGLGQGYPPQQPEEPHAIYSAVPFVPSPMYQHPMQQYTHAPYQMIDTSQRDQSRGRRKTMRDKNMMHGHNQEMMARTHGHVAHYDTGYSYPYQYPQYPYQQMQPVHPSTGSPIYVYHPVYEFHPQLGVPPGPPGPKVSYPQTPPVSVPTPAPVAPVVLPPPPIISVPPVAVPSHPPPEPMPVRIQAPPAPLAAPVPVPAAPAPTPAAPTPTPAAPAPAAPAPAPAVTISNEAKTPHAPRPSGPTTPLGATSSGPPAGAVLTKRAVEVKKPEPSPEESVIAKVSQPVNSTAAQAPPPPQQQKSEAEPVTVSSAPAPTPLTVTAPTIPTPVVPAPTPATASTTVSAPTPAPDMSVPTISTPGPTVSQPAKSPTPETTSLPAQTPVVNTSSKSDESAAPSQNTSSPWGSKASFASLFNSSKSSSTSASYTSSSAPVPNSYSTNRSDGPQAVSPPTQSGWGPMQPPGKSLHSIQPKTSAVPSGVAPALPPPNPSHEPRLHRLSEWLHEYTLDHKPASLQPRGLTNRNNWCYINATLQALLACPPFYNLFNSLPESCLPIGRSSSESHTAIIESMKNFVKEFNQLPSSARLKRADRAARSKDGDIQNDVPTGSAFEPTCVYRMLSVIRTDTMVEGRQEDAEEFLSCLLNGLNDEMLELMKISGDLSNGDISASSNGETESLSQDEVDDWKVMGSKQKGTVIRQTNLGRTPLSDIFRGKLKSRVSRSGQDSTDNVQPFFTLQLDIENSSSVKDALEAYTKKESLEGITCSRSNQEILAWQEVHLEELPPVLLLHLKCFDYSQEGCTKIVKSIRYEVDLKVESKILSSKKIKPNQQQYKLFAVVYHDGKEATKGHYITDAFHVGYNTWIRYDDSSVKAMSLSQVLTPRAPRVPYLLYYRRFDTM